MSQHNQILIGIIIGLKLIGLFAAETLVDGTPLESDRAITAARNTLPAWRSKSPVERGQIVHRIAERIREHADELATIESRDQGKPLAQARDDIEGAARYFEYYAGAADKLEALDSYLQTKNISVNLDERNG